MLLKEILNIPRGAYGFWIDDRGKLLVVSGGEDHLTVGRKHLKADEDVYTLAHNKGWVRIVYSPQYPTELEIDFPPKISGATKKTAIEFIQDIGHDLRAIYISFGTGSDGFMDEAQYIFPKVKEPAKHAIKDIRGKR